MEKYRINNLQVLTLAFLFFMPVLSILNINYKQPTMNDFQEQNSY